MSCDCCPCWKARNRARIAVNDPETPPANPRNKWGLAGVSSFGSSGNAGPVSYVMARQGAYSSPDPSPGGKKGRYPQLEHTILVPVFSSVP